MWRRTAGVLGNFLACDEKPLQAAGKSRIKDLPCDDVFPTGSQRNSREENSPSQLLDCARDINEDPCAICQVSSSEEETDNV